MTDNTIASITDALAEKVRDLGRQAREHGERVEKACNEYAARLLKDQQDLRNGILAADEQMKDDIEALIGASVNYPLPSLDPLARGMTKQ